MIAPVVSADDAPPAYDTISIDRSDDILPAYNPISVWQPPRIPQLQAPVPKRTDRMFCDRCTALTCGIVSLLALALMSFALSRKANT